MVRTRLIVLICLAIFWLGLSGAPEGHLPRALFIIAPLMALLISLALSLPFKKFPFKIRTFYYCLWLLKEIVMATITVIKLSWQKNPGLHYAMRPIKSIQKSDIGLVIYANSITLTPGTITLSTHNDVLMVHALDAEIMDDLESGKMDRIIKELVE